MTGAVWSERTQALLERSTQAGGERAGGAGEALGSVGGRAGAGGGPEGFAPAHSERPGRGTRRQSVQGNHERTLCLPVTKAAQPRERPPGVAGEQSRLM